MVTGKDETSLFILKALTEGIRVKDIPEQFQVSLDQAKRLSRYQKILVLGKQNLENTSYCTLTELGLRSLVLSPLFKAEDWEGIEDILSSIEHEENVTRDELKQYLAALRDKRDRIKEFQERITQKIHQAENSNQELLNQQTELLLLQEQISESFQFFNHFPKETREFLLEYVGFYNGEYILIKRFDSLWHKKLKKLNILEYDESNYIHRINSIEQLVDEWIERNKRKGNIEWDYDREYKRHANSFYSTPTNPYYKIGENLVPKNLRAQVNKIQSKIDNNKLTIKQLYEELEDFKKQSVTTFIEKVEKSNHLSAKELKRHGQLQEKASKWLYKQGYVVVNELTLPNGKRVDTIGINEDNHVIIIEAKASIQDLQRDDKWLDYLAYSDAFYFCLEYDYRHLINKSTLSAGCLVEYKNGLTAAAESTLNHSCKDSEKIRYMIGRALSKKSIYGY